MDSMIVLTYDPLSIDLCFEHINKKSHGGNCIFIGTVRNPNKGKAIRHLDFESHLPMAHRELENICDQILSNYPGSRIYISHRLGQVEPGQIVVIIGVSGAHRKETFENCSTIIDTLKQTVPIWKKETTTDGEFWVNAFP